MSISHPNAGPPPPPVRRTPFDVLGTRWGAWGLSVVAMTGLVYYLAWVAPELAPAPPGARSAFPQTTALLESIAAWCGAHRAATALLAALMLLPGLLTTAIEPRRHLLLAAVLGGALAFCFLTFSAPVDRLLEQVRSALSESRPVPDYLPGRTQKTP